MTADAPAPLVATPDASASGSPGRVTSRALPRPLVALFAVACGLAVANVYYAHPVLDAIAASFGIGQATVGIVVTVTQIGYGIGLVLLVPLGDVLDRRRLIVTQLVLSTVALVVVGAAPSTIVLLAGMVMVGVLAVVTQVLVAFAATVAGEHERGAVVGTVTSGVVIGILLARTFAGAITDVAGWRAVYLVSAALTLTVSALLSRYLPSLPRPAQRIGYRRLLRSMLTLYATERTLRIRAGLAMLIFAAFNVLWTSLLLPLREPPHSMSHGAIGLLGLVGAAGALGAARAGRLADRGLGRVTTGVALALLLVSWLPIALVRHSLLGARRRARHAGPRGPGRTRDEPEHDLPDRSGSTQPARRRVHGVLFDRQRRRRDRLDGRLRPGRLDRSVPVGRRDQRYGAGVVGDRRASPEQFDRRGMTLRRADAE